MNVWRSNRTTRPIRMQLMDRDSSQLAMVRGQTRASLATSAVSSNVSDCVCVCIWLKRHLAASRMMQFGCLGCKVSGNYFPYV